MTHDLIKILLMGLDASITKVVVSELKDDTFYALIWLEREGKLMSIDSRPSDALGVEVVGSLLCFGADDADGQGGFGGGAAV